MINKSAPLPEKDIPLALKLVEAFADYLLILSNPENLQIAKSFSVPFGSGFFSDYLIPSPGTFEYARNRGKYRIFYSQLQKRFNSPGERAKLPYLGPLDWAIRTFIDDPKLQRQMLSYTQHDKISRLLIRRQLIEAYHDYRQILLNPGHFNKGIISFATLFSSGFFMHYPIPSLGRFEFTPGMGKYRALDARIRRQFDLLDGQTASKYSPVEWAITALVGGSRLGKEMLSYTRGKASKPKRREFIASARLNLPPLLLHGQSQVHADTLRAMKTMEYARQAMGVMQEKMEKKENAALQKPKRLRII